jgi:hypothetical protein
MSHEEKNKTIQFGRVSSPLRPLVSIKEKSELVG